MGLEIRYIYEWKRDMKKNKVCCNSERWEKHFNVLCSGTAVARLTVEETLYKYTWAVLQGWVEEQQYAADAVVNIHNKHQSPGRPSQKQ